jgi:hypothetical protein
LEQLCGQDRQTISVVIGAHQVIAGGLARRIRAVWFVAIGLGKGRIFLAKRAINFVGRNVQETEGALLVALQPAPVGTHRFEQAEGTDDVGLDEIFRSVNAAVDVRFSGEIDDSARPVFGQQARDQIEVADISFDKHVAVIIFQACQIVWIPGVGQDIQVDNLFTGSGKPVDNKIAANESGTTGNEYGH